jgi:signal peptidase I
VRDFMKGLFKFLGVVALIAFVIGGVLYGFYVKVVEVGHNAMAPTVFVGDRVLVWKGHNFDLGDIALCPHPSEPGRYVMGRVVGRTGQRVAIDRGQLLINGETPESDLHSPISFSDAETGRTEQMIWGIESILNHDHLFFVRAGRAGVPNLREQHVRGGQLYLMSDNRTYVGEDSRAFGGVNEGTCIGAVFMRLTAGAAPPEIPHAALDILE